MALFRRDIYTSESGSAENAWHESTPPCALVPIVPSVVSLSENCLVNCLKQEKDVESHFQRSSSIIIKSQSTVKRGVYGVTTCFSELTFGSFFLDLSPVLILEIFSHLDARELGIVSCVCSLFRRLASDSNGWKEFYCERWGLPIPCASRHHDLHALPGKSWQELYMAKEARCKALLGRFQMDMLHGHTGAVRAVRLLPPVNLVFTAGYDCILRIWNLQEGLPVAWSRPLGETIRAIAVDMGMLAVAGSDAVIRIWNASPVCPHIFEVAGVTSESKEYCLRGHSGPITCLGLDSSNLYSGSWDMSIRVWERASYKNVLSLSHWDWVWALVPRGRRVLSTAGSDAYTWDTETGKLLRLRVETHVGQAYAVEGSRSGHHVITGGEDGAVRMFDDRVSCRHGLIAEWFPHSSAVYSLAFEDPWLVSASGDGSLAMMDVRRAIKKFAAIGKNTSSVNLCKSSVLDAADTVQRKLCAFNQCAYSVDVGADRIVSGGEERIVRIWDFSHALEIEKRVQASRSIRLKQRLRRKQGTVALATSGAQA